MTIAFKVSNIILTSPPTAGVATHETTMVTYDALSQLKGCGVTVRTVASAILSGVAQNRIFENKFSIVVASGVLVAGSTGPSSVYGSRFLETWSFTHSIVGNALRLTLETGQTVVEATFFSQVELVQLVLP